MTLLLILISNNIMGSTGRQDQGQFSV